MNRQNVDPDWGSNCWPRLTADDESRSEQGISYIGLNMKVPVLCPHKRPRFMCASVRSCCMVFFYGDNLSNNLDPDQARRNAASDRSLQDSDINIIIHFSE